MARTNFGSLLCAISVCHSWMVDGRSCSGGPCSGIEPAVPALSNACCMRDVDRCSMDRLRNVRFLSTAASFPPERPIKTFAKPVDEPTCPTGYDKARHTELRQNGVSMRAQIECLAPFSFMFGLITWIMNSLLIQSCDTVSIRSMCRQSRGC